MNNINETKNDENLAVVIFYDVISKIQSGVETSKGTIRPYDILDYYQNDGIEMSKIIENVYGKVESKDLEILRNFLKKNQKGATLKDYDKRQILNLKNVRLLKDENGVPIPGTERVITTTEKEKIFAYIENNNLPMTSGIYSAALDRYINGELVLDRVQKK